MIISGASAGVRLPSGEAAALSQLPLSLWSLPRLCISSPGNVTTAPRDHSSHLDGRHPEIVSVIDFSDVELPAFHRGHHAILHGKSKLSYSFYIMLSLLCLYDQLFDCLRVVVRPTTVMVEPMLSAVISQRMSMRCQP